MQPNGMIFWDWNGTLMDDVDFTHGCLNWMLESHGYPQRYDLAQYRELFRFPIEDYYRLAGFDFSRHPYPMLAEHFMAHYNAGVDACPVMATPWTPSPSWPAAAGNRLYFPPPAGTT